MGRILAAADIGSNTAHLLIAEVTEAGVRRIVNDSDWLSLGEVVGREGIVPPKLADKLIETLEDFKSKSVAHKAEQMYVFATEAIRRAENHDQILRRIAEVTGLYVEMISPRREAQLSLMAIQKSGQVSGPFTLVEAGGGSVQVAACDGSGLGLEVSLPLGTGILIAESSLMQPAPKVSIDRLSEVIATGLTKLKEFPKGQPVIACGGVARGIWRALHPDGDNRLELPEFDHLAWDTARLTTRQIAARYSVKPKRAATLLPGSTLYARILRTLESESMVVSEYGVREGAIWEMAERVKV